MLKLVASDGAAGMGTTSVSATTLPVLNPTYGTASSD